MLSRFKMKLLLNDAYNEVFKEVIEELGETITEGAGMGLTDAGNISQVVPTIHPYLKIGADDLTPHTVPFREAAISKKGDEALITGAKALGLTALRLVTEPDTLIAIKVEFKQRKEAEAQIK